MAIAWKSVLQRIRPRCESKPVFVLGKQRSGTSMLMFVFHRHPQVLVFDEHKNNRAFQDFRLRSTESVEQIVDDSHFPVVCFKPISDSHLIADLHSAFPDGHSIWIYRDYRDAANSSLRKFDNATRAIRLVCTGQPGGGWFQEGVSESAAAVLRSIYRPDLSEFDLACLAWWARNQIILESGLTNAQNVTLVKYEALVTAPPRMLAWLCNRTGIEYRERIGKIISARSIGRHEAPPMDARVRELCDAALTALDEAFQRGNPPFKKY